MDTNVRTCELRSVDCVAYIMAVGKQSSPNVHQFRFLQPRCHSALLSVAIITEIEKAIRRIWRCNTFS